MTIKQSDSYPTIKINIEARVREQANNRIADLVKDLSELMEKYDVDYLDTFDIEWSYNADS